MKICRENPDFAKNGQNYRALYMKTQVRFIAADNITTKNTLSLTKMM